MMIKFISNSKVSRVNISIFKKISMHLALLKFINAVSQF